MRRLSSLDPDCVHRGFFFALLYLSINSSEVTISIHPRLCEQKGYYSYEPDSPKTLLLRMRKTIDEEDGEAQTHYRKQQTGLNDRRIYQGSED